ALRPTCSLSGSARSVPWSGDESWSATRAPRPNFRTLSQSPFDRSDTHLRRFRIHGRDFGVSRPGGPWFARDRRCEGSARLLPIDGTYAAGARAVCSTSRNESGSFARPNRSPARGNTPSDQIHSRTEHTASEKLTPALPGQLTPPDRFDSGRAWYSSATT